MDLREEIKKDLRKSLKRKEEIKTSTLRLLTSSILNKEKEKRLELSKKEELEGEELEEKSKLNSEELLEVISSEVKKRKDSIVEYKKAGREDLANKEEQEAEILKKYLPEQMSGEEIEKIVKEVIQETGASSMRDMGKVMSVIMPKVKGKADGKEINNMVKKLLSE
jgi:hypothetical protein